MHRTVVLFLALLVDLVKGNCDRLLGPLNLDFLQKYTLDDHRLFAELSKSPECLASFPTTELIQAAFIPNNPQKQTLLGLLHDLLCFLKTEKATSDESSELGIEELSSHYYMHDLGGDAFAALAQRIPDIALLMEVESLSMRKSQPEEDKHAISAMEVLFYFMSKDQLAALPPTIYYAQASLPESYRRAMLAELNSLAGILGSLDLNALAWDRTWVQRMNAVGVGHLIKNRRDCSALDTRMLSFVEPGDQMASPLSPGVRTFTVGSRKAVFTEDASKAFAGPCLLTMQNVELLAGQESMMRLNPKAFCRVPKALPPCIFEAFSPQKKVFLSNFDIDVEREEGARKVPLLESQICRFLNLEAVKEDALLMGLREKCLFGCLANALREKQTVHVSDRILAKFPKLSRELIPAVAWSATSFQTLVRVVSALIGPEGPRNQSEVSICLLLQEKTKEWKDLKDSDARNLPLSCLSPDAVEAMSKESRESLTILNRPGSVRLLTPTTVALYSDRQLLLILRANKPPAMLSISDEQAITMIRSGKCCSREMSKWLQEAKLPASLAPDASPPSSNESSPLIQPAPTNTPPLSPKKGNPFNTPDLQARPIESKSQPKSGPLIARKRPVRIPAKPIFNARSLETNPFRVEEKAGWMQKLKKNWIGGSLIALIVLGLFFILVIALIVACGKSKTRDEELKDDEGEDDDEESDDMEQEEDDDYDEAEFEPEDDNQV